jgi:hypothetical protein
MKRHADFKVELVIIMDPQAGSTVAVVREAGLVIAVGTGSGSTVAVVSWGLSNRAYVYVGTLCTVGCSPWYFGPLCTPRYPFTGCVRHAAETLTPIEFQRLQKPAFFVYERSSH